MSDDPKEGTGSERPSAVGNHTMQIDAIVDELESGDEIPVDAVLAQILADSTEEAEAADAAGAAPALPAPPPLPPKKVGKGTIAVGALIVALATAGGILLGMSFLDEPQAPAVAAPVAGGEGDAVDEEASIEDGEGAEVDEGEFVPVQLGEIVVPLEDEAE